jgi:hypothetical protein
MRHVVTVVAVAVMASLLFVPVASAQSKWARGNVVSVGPDTVTVAVMGKDMAFKVTKDTELIARGAGTAQQQAEEKGQPGVKLVDFVKPGAGVEIEYKEAAAVMTATVIRSGVSVGAGATSSDVSGGAMRGSVSAVSGNSITVSDGKKDWVFAVDAKTKVVGTGLGTLNEKLKAQGKAATVPDLVAVKDKVFIYYQEGPSPRASEIRVTLKAVK